MSTGVSTIPLIRCKAILFDLDGVLVDSRKCIELVWRTWAASRGLDPEPFLRVAHGRKPSDTVRLVAPHLDVAAETEVLDAMEETETRGLSAAPGAAALLQQLTENQWAVVTSGGRNVALLRLRTAGLNPPRVLITAEAVTRHKPDPEGYLTAASRLGLGHSDCIVVEDSPTGVAAGKAAAMRVIGVLTNYPPASLKDADALVPALSDLRVGHAGATGLSVEF